MSEPNDEIVPKEQHEQPKPHRLAYKSFSLVILGVILSPFVLGFLRVFEILGDSLTYSALMDLTGWLAVLSTFSGLGGVITGFISVIKEKKKRIFAIACILLGMLVFLLGLVMIYGVFFAM